MKYVYSSIIEKEMHFNICSLSLLRFLFQNKFHDALQYSGASDAICQHLRQQETLASVARVAPLLRTIVSRVNA